MLSLRGERINGSAALAPCVRGVQPEVFRKVRVKSPAVRAEMPRKRPGGGAQKQGSRNEAERRGAARV